MRRSSAPIRAAFARFPRLAASVAASVAALAIGGGCRRPPTPTPAIEAPDARHLAAADAGAAMAIDSGAPSGGDGASSGPWLHGGALRPTTATTTPWRRACALRVPICVHAPLRVDGAHVLSVLASVERAWAMLNGPLATPPPDPDPVTRAYDVYLETRGDPRDGVTALGERDPRGGMDRASAFSVIDARIAAGCALDRVVAREVALAALYRAAPATADALAAATTAYLARLIAPCALAEPDGIDLAQAAPEAALFGARRDLPPRLADEAARGMSLYVHWLDASFGAQPGAIVRGLWTLSATQTPFGAARWNDEPDALGVLRESFKGVFFHGSTIHDLALELAIARAFAGRDGLLELAALGSAAHVALAWDVPWPERPRRLAAPVPVAPFGSSYVKIRGVPAGGRLRIEAAWEEHAMMRWAAVKLDANGLKIGQIPIVGHDRGTSAQRTIADLTGADSVLIVATNVGDPSFTLDPDDEVWEPHAWLLTIAAE